MLKLCISNVAMTETFEFYIWGANNKFACMTGNNTNLTIPTKFNPKTISQLSDQIILTIWPGYHSSRIICSRSKKNLN